MEAPDQTRQAATPTGTAADVVSALLNLGYEQRAAEQAVERAGKGARKGDGAETFEELLRATLQQLSAPGRAGLSASQAERAAR
jgi:Holliday junction resolvasome RuvABC DNA-binding subunit